MNDDAVLLEILSRIQSLEEQVKLLSEKLSGETPSGRPVPSAAPAVSTADIRRYIVSLKSAAWENGNSSLTIKANDIHKALHLKSRFPMVCNAMRQCMNAGDEVIFAPASGYSSTLEIKYYLSRQEDA